LAELDDSFGPRQDQDMGDNTRMADQLPGGVALVIRARANPNWRCLVLLVSGFGVNLVVGADYFVTGNGDDAAPGTATNQAWRTIDRVNRAHLLPGDRVLFEAGRAFAGNLRLTAEDAGTSNTPVAIGSFGEGRATISAGSDTGITVANAGGVTIENLVIRGTGRTNNTGYGIFCDNTLEEARLLEHLRLENVEVSGFGRHGIMVTGAPAGFRHVRIHGCVMRDNLRGGMEVAGRLPWDSPRYAHADVRVSYCQAFDNTGDPNYQKNHSGSGIVLYQVDGGLMEHCLAWNNGALCRTGGGGAVGLWTCASRRVVIQHCESFGNKTSGADGGGFDIDGGSEDCVLQYNYSHDNDGPGLMVYTYPYASHTDRGNVVRFNISENDSRKSRSYAGLWIRSDGHGMTGIEAYNNTVFMGPWADQAVGIHGDGVEATFRNNVFVGAGGAVPLRVEKPHDKLRFENNLYWRVGGPVQIVWGERSYPSLKGWRKETGQELLDGHRLGLFENPKLSPHPAGVRAGERIGISALQAFRPLPGSPARSGGLNLEGRFGTETGSTDLFGDPLPAQGAWPLGAVSGQVRR
jgi:hypothetical protein